MLLLGLGFCLFLQTPMAAGLYRSVPGFRFVQFPWRLLSLATPLSILLAGWVAAGLAAREKELAVGLAALCLAGFVLFCPAWAKIEYGWFEASEVEAKLAWSPDFALMSSGEYLPAIDRPDVNILPHRLQYLRFLQGVYPAPNRACQVSLTHPMLPERLEQDAHLHCQEPGVVVLPFIHSGLEKVWLLGGAEPVRLLVHRTPGDPRVRVRVPAGESRVRLVFPRFEGLLD